MSKNDESPKTVADIAKKVIVNSTERAIPLTPENYYVWFEYFLGFNKDLEDAINAIINSKGYFSEETNRSLYNEFINQSNHEVLEEIQKESYKIFQNILREKGYTVLVRDSRGSDISAACGQLAGQTQ